MTGSAFKAMDVVVACVLVKREEVWRREGSRSTLMGGRRINFHDIFLVSFWEWFLVAPRRPQGALWVGLGDKREAKW